MKQITSRNISSGWQRLEYGLLAVGFLCAACFVFIAMSAWISDREAHRYGVSGNVVHAQASPGGDFGRVNEIIPNSGPEAAVMGRLEIPALALSVPILSDFESASLRKGVGHIPGTAMPGGLGTLGLAGHRDTYFRPLRGIKTNMEIRVAGRDGIYRYIVDSTEIVKPENVQVLDIRSRPELTLITCYPFYYVGAAPLRFIVHAHLVSAIPDSER